ncbi:MAG: hypothetical protein ACYSUI_16990, partial [Planctomycetota bacterium]
FNDGAVSTTLPLTSGEGWTGGTFTPDGLVVSDGGPICNVADGQCGEVGLTLDAGDGYVIATWLERTGGDEHTVFWQSQHPVGVCDGYAFHARGPNRDGISPAYPLAFYDGCGRRLAQSTLGLPPGSDEHFVAAWTTPDGSETRLYIDGVDVTASQVFVSRPGDGGAHQGVDEGVNDWPVPSQNAPQSNGTVQLGQSSRSFIGRLWDLTTASNVSSYDAEAHFIIPEPSRLWLDASAVLSVMTWASWRRRRRSA